MARLPHRFLFSPPCISPLGCFFTLGGWIQKRCRTVFVLFWWATARVLCVRAAPTSRSNLHCTGKRSLILLTRKGCLLLLHLLGPQTDKFVAALYLFPPTAAMESAALPGPVGATPWRTFWHHERRSLWPPADVGCRRVPESCPSDRSRRGGRGHEQRRGRSAAEHQVA